jgi:hypothetical protein
MFIVTKDISKFWEELIAWRRRKSRKGTHRNTDTDGQLQLWAGGGGAAKRLNGNKAVS